MKEVRERSVLELVIVIIQRGGFMQGGFGEDQLADWALQTLSGRALGLSS